METAGKTAEVPSQSATSSAGGERTGEMKEFANVQIKAVLQPTAAEALLARVESEQFPRCGMIAFESDLRVMRSGKF